MIDNRFNTFRNALKCSPSVYLSSVAQHTTLDGMLYDTADYGDMSCIVVLTRNDLRLRIMYDSYEAPVIGRRVREETYLTIGHDF